MTKQSVSAAGDSPTNEELVFRFQSGDPSASELLLRQNSDYLTALAKQYDSIIHFIEEKKLDVWTHNKAIQKSIESYRITPEQKEYLRTLKIKR